MKKTAIVIGSTGLVGSYLVELLVNNPAYEQVITYARRQVTPNHPQLVQKYLPAAPVKDGELEADELYCCLGTTIKKAGSQTAFRYADFDLPLMFAKAAKSSGVKHFLLVTAMGADPDSRIFYSRVKGELEVAINQLAFPTFTIVRPWLLTGPRKEFRLGEKIGEPIQALINPLLIGTLRHFRSVPALDVARCLVSAAQDPAPGYHLIRSGDILRSA